MLLSKKMDAGPIIVQGKINIELKDNHETLNNKLFSLGNRLLLGNLQKYINQKIQVHSQDSSQATYAQMIEKKDGLIDWNNSAEEINNKIRAFYNWPGAYTYFNDKLLKIIEADFTTKKTKHKISEVFLDNDKVTIQTKTGLIYPLIVQIEGKQKMDINPFINGYKNFIGTILKSSLQK